jgi:hypothetical protein
MGSEWVPSVVRLFTDAIGWVGAILLLLVLRNFIIYGISAVLRDAIVNASAEKQRLLIRFLVNKDMVLSDLYKYLRERSEPKELK